MLFRSLSSRVLLNGIHGDPTKLGRGLRQEEPLSPLLFDLAIDLLQQCLDKATTQGNLHRLRGRGAHIRTSLFADDVAIFMNPIKEDILFLTNTLRNFGNVTGLIPNMEKRSFVPIRCKTLDLTDILQSFPAMISTFPLKYLGLPLSVHRLNRSDRKSTRLNSSHPV